MGQDLEVKGLPGDESQERGDGAAVQERDGDVRDARGHIEQGEMERLSRRIVAERGGAMDGSLAEIVVGDDVVEQVAQLRRCSNSPKLERTEPPKAAEAIPAALLREPGASLDGVEPEQGLHPDADAHAGAD